MATSPIKLLFFTKNYPCGFGEAFIENEIITLSSEFEEVHIFPSSWEGEKRNIPKNCFVHKLEFKPTSGQKRLIFQYFFKIIRIILLDFFSKENRVALFRPKAYFHNLMRLLFEAKALESYIDENNLTGPSNIHYTYWFDHWTSVLSILKNSNTTLVSRAHGYDFNLERNKNNFFWFRPYALQKLSNVYNVSKFGSTYLKERYPSKESKVNCSYLGVTEQSIISSNDQRTIVSCSNLIPLKRVHLIPQILKQSSKRIHWVHFGDGPELAKIQNEASSLPENITFELKGQISNTEILQYYSNNPVGLFLHLSESEGLPVSMMEAQSFGLPIIACDTGGVNEIVNNETGTLLDINLPFSIVIESIESWLKSDINKRKSIQNHQQKYFSSTRNYLSFCNEIKK